MNNVIHYILWSVVLMLLACTGGKPASERDESREAKRLMQGVWIDDDSENAVFQMRGDSVYYSDSTSMPAYFRVVDDTLFIGAEGRYHIEKQTEHLLWIKSMAGELTKLRKSDDEQLSEKDIRKQNHEVARNIKKAAAEEDKRYRQLERAEKKALRKAARQQKK